MAAINLVILIILFFLTSVVGVVTGSNSLITVPVMFEFGVDEKVAVATNMFGLSFAESVASTKLINVFSSGVATLVFAWQGLIDYRLGVILAVTMFLGAYFGAHYATKL